jgi:hypothetical protein
MRLEVRTFKDVISDSLPSAVDLREGARLLHSWPFFLSASFLRTCAEQELVERIKRHVADGERRVRQSYMATTRGLNA